MYQGHRITAALKIIELYLKSAIVLPATVMPLSVFLSQYYRTNKQMGSKDRKIASGLVYNYFRLGNIMKDESIKDRLMIANFLCQNKNDSFLASIFENSRFQNLLELPFSDKLEFISKEHQQLSTEKLFSFIPDFSQGINATEFYRSFFTQPLLWVRVKKGRMQQVIEELEENNVNYYRSEEFPNTLSFINGTSLETLKSKQNGLFEIQDLSSQLTGGYFEAKSGENWWDCCAASGGKSLLLCDGVSGIKILATDTRETILTNLKNRFHQAGIKNFEVIRADLMKDVSINKPFNFFDGIIADVPCSGSGTWARTPEMLSFFSQQTMLEFQHKQKTIVGNVVPYLKKSQALIYITCSVFKAENEDVINYLAEKHNLAIEFSQLICGYNRQSDTLFVARLVKR